MYHYTLNLLVLNQLPSQSHSWSCPLTKKLDTSRIQVFRSPHHSSWLVSGLHMKISGRNLYLNIIPIVLSFRLGRACPRLYCSQGEILFHRPAWTPTFICLLLKPFYKGYLRTHQICFLEHSFQPVIIMDNPNIQTEQNICSLIIHLTCRNLLQHSSKPPQF
ncbi:hypothetical protein ATANTOWER_019783 [Ataeniobius toweri]|uniref:Uncharacterized protein n=1 Tax=Ataeniobius toweri TaxID=208326 RepID=A0ABU7BZR8_9TELE|nr:hypothetical protein [Ataeniobius toweri]